MFNQALTQTPIPTPKVTNQNQNRNPKKLRSTDNGDVQSNKTYKI